MRILALDVGEKTVGTALCDELEIVANPRETLKRDGVEIPRLAEWIAREEIGEVVVGLPLNMDGSQGPSARRSLEFAARLQERVSVPVVTWDERLTTAEAERMLISADVRRTKRKQVIDSLAATLILQSYLQRPKQRPLSREHLDDEEPAS